MSGQRASDIAKQSHTPLIARRPATANMSAGYTCLRGCGSSTENRTQRNIRKGYNKNDIDVCYGQGRNEKYKCRHLAKAGSTTTRQTSPEHNNPTNFSQHPDTSDRRHELASCHKTPVKKKYTCLRLETFRHHTHPSLAWLNKKKNMPDY